MGKFKRLKNQTFAKVYTKIPSLVDLYAKQADLVVNTTTPFTPLKKPLAECQISLVTTGGVHTKKQKPFDMADKKGDPSYRELSSDINLEQLTITHDYYNHDDALGDPNLVLPIEPLRELLQQGKIGAIGPRFFSFMGHIMGNHIKTLTQETAPEVAAALIDDRVDAVFLAPTWGLCNQSVGLIQRILEEGGISTVSISLNLAITKKVKPPRALYPGFSLGHPLGRAHDRDIQLRVLQDTLGLLEMDLEPGEVVINSY